MILLIDNYDSFTYNLYQYLSEFHDNVMVIRNDEITVEEIIKLNPLAIIISPGPKKPEEAGVCVNVVKMLSGIIPILGICLGHQCIGEAFGGRVIKAKAIFHGKQSPIYYSYDVIFNGISLPFQGARYHSLVVDRETLPRELSIIAETKDGVIMGIKHREHYVYGLQFHPESIYTKEGMKIITNFLEGIQRL
ncbi:anthranilate synthase component II [Vallitalea okinawensis]|uniref:anthranilate synthase component II n=1 Tax=Vallitalea okinawensis TaxID=2078660 RepID=UPI000CFC3079|nr:aminodeoxychorismate/anthranilate synthase component II [Vallitalea okinawensis]